MVSWSYVWVILPNLSIATAVFCRRSAYWSIDYFNSYNTGSSSITWRRSAMSHSSVQHSVLQAPEAVFSLHCPASRLAQGPIILNWVAKQSVILNPMRLSKWRSKPSVVSRIGHPVLICFAVYAAFPLISWFSIIRWLTRKGFFR